MNIENENKNIANDQSKGMMNAKGTQQDREAQPSAGTETDFQQLGKVASDRPDPGRHHGVFTGPGQENLRQYGEHHYESVDGQSKDLHKDQKERNTNDQRN